MIWTLVKHCWADVVFPASVPVPSSFEPKKRRTHACNGSFWERVWLFPLIVNCETVRFPKASFAKGPGMALGYLVMVSNPNLSNPEQSWLHDCVSRAHKLLSSNTCQFSYSIIVKQTCVTNEVLLNQQSRI